MFRTSNPTHRADIFGPAETWTPSEGQAQVSGEREADRAATRAVRDKKSMTMQGTVNKSFFLLALCVTTGVVAWNLTIPTSMGGEYGHSPLLYLLGGAIGGLILALVAIFKPRTSPVTAPLYALAEGFVVGSASGLYAAIMTERQAMDQGALDASIVFQAVLATFGTFGAMLLAYTLRLIKPTKKFRSIVVTATFGILGFYLLSFVLSFFGVSSGLGSVSWLGLGISGFIVIVAALNLIMDFDFIEQGVRNGIPKWGEWFGGFTMLVTLVWLYLEMLRLIFILRAMFDE